MRRLVLATLLLSALGVADASACNVNGFRFRFGTDTTTNMLVTSGRRCAVLVRAGGRSTFSGISISAPPRNGTVRAEGSRAVYQSRPGYRGTDSFAFAVSGSGPSTSGTTTIQVAVTVQ